MLDRLVDLVDSRGPRGYLDVFVRAWRAPAVHPRVTAMRRRFEPRLAFLRDLPSPDNSFTIPH